MKRFGFPGIVLKTSGRSTRRPRVLPRPLQRQVSNRTSCVINSTIRTPGMKINKLYGSDPIPGRFRKRLRSDKGDGGSSLDGGPACRAEEMETTGSTAATRSLRRTAAWARTSAPTRLASAQERSASFFEPARLTRPPPATRQACPAAPTSRPEPGAEDRRRAFRRSASPEVRASGSAEQAVCYREFRPRIPRETALNEVHWRIADESGDKQIGRAARLAHR